MSNYNLLIVDDVPETVKTTGELLALHGFHVYTATNPEQALQVVEATRIHLVLLDLCLTGDGDPSDGGLDLAQALDAAIPKIIITKFPSFDTLYRTLPAAGQNAFIVDYVLKQDGFEHLLQRIKDALEKYAPINWQLKIRFSERFPVWQRLSLARLTELIVPTSEDPMVEAQKIDELLRLLFRKHEEIVIERVVSATPRRVALEVRGNHPERGNGNYLVVYGSEADVAGYEQQRQHYAPKDGDARVLHKEFTARIPGYTAYAYLLHGLRLASSMSLREFYHTADAASMTEMLDDLLRHVVQPWSARAPIVTNPKEAAAFFRTWLQTDSPTAPERQLQQCIAHLVQATLRLGAFRINLVGQAIEFHLPDAEPAVRHLALPTNALRVEYLLSGGEHLVGTVNGAVDLETVLVDPERKGCTLIEFAHATRGPLCADYALLEHSLRLQLSSAVNLSTRLKCEAALLAMPNLTTPPDMTGLDPEVQKLMRAITRVRYLAGTHSPIRDLKAYHASILFAALRHLLTTPVENQEDPGILIKLVHSLLCAALIYDDLTREQEHVTVDQNQRIVTIHGREVPLTPQLLRLFTYLYEHRNQVCTKKELLREALEMPDIKTSADVQRNESTLQNLISRLRQLIEPDFQRPIYLETVRASGYRLKL
ncbi:MAG: DNA-binding response regulator [Chloroflexia bacterium]|nr:DNA-binding response regulator [Chloroflexia bacterium]